MAQSRRRTLADARPDLAAQWHPTKNGTLSPADVTFRSGMKVWWLCGSNHDWQASPDSRAHKGCPYCSKRRVHATNSLAATHPNLAAEWHPTNTGTLAPTDVVAGTNRRLWWRCAHGHAWHQTGNARIRGLGCPYCSGRLATQDDNLAVHFPALAAQWHPTKNGALGPDSVTPSSDRRVWWLCSDAHVWETTVGNRARGTGCPVCSGRVATPATSLAALHPTVAAEWHATSNWPTTPADVRPGSSRMFWWTCNRGHDWLTTVAARTAGRGCPACASRTVTGDNCLAAVRPDLAAEWHPTKNGTLTPYDVLPATNRTLWWNCAAGHAWEAQGNNRANGGGCPYCLNRRVDETNCLAVTRPDLAAEWHPARNGSLTPRDVVAGTSRRVWWRCARGHSWADTGNSRSQPSGGGCPYCARRRAAPDNCLAVTHPIIASEWHPTRNGALTARDVLAGTNRHLWWQCPTGHEWEATGNDRLSGTGCPYCRNRRVDTTNCLATTHPGLAEQWHPTRNGTLTPYDIVAGTTSRIWWLCALGHEWAATGNSRTSNSSGCPDCAVNGFQYNAPALVYLLTNGEAHKIGIAGGPSRLSEHQRYGWTIVEHRWLPSGHLARQTELAVLTHLRTTLALPPHYTTSDMPQGGATETVTGGAVTVETLIRLIDDAVTRVTADDPTLGSTGVSGQTVLF